MESGDEDLDEPIREMGANTPVLHYRIIDRLGEGGAAIVYKARDTRLDRVVVLKMLKKSLARQDGGKERFLREARLASALDHPNIAGIYNIHDEGGLTFIVMQYVEGVPLNQVLSDSRMELTTALSIAIQVVDGLCHAHARGIIHRDMKPSNVLITSTGQAKILDFGLAKRGDREGTESALITKHGQLIGTPLFISPELAQGEEADARTDIFSTGILLYQLLTGKLPFVGANRIEVLHAVTQIEPTPPTLINRRLPPRLDAVVARALAKRREDRYPEMRAFLEDLEEVARDRFESQGAAPVGSNPLRFFRRGDPQKEGYLGRLMAKVFRFSEDGGLRKAPVVNLPVARRRYPSVAVLPFAGVGADASVNSFGDTLRDRLASELGRGGTLSVTPWVAVAAALGGHGDPVVVGHELKVSTVLTGTYFRTAEGLRLTPQLIRVETGETLWSEVFDLAGSDTLALSDRAAPRVAAVLLGTLLGKPGSRHDETENAEAYELSRRAKYLQLRRLGLPGRRGDLERAVSLYKEALHLDPDYAKAQGELGVTYLAFIQGGMGDETHADLAEHAFDRALKLRPELLEPTLYRIPLLLRQGRKETCWAQWRSLAPTWGADPRFLDMSILLYRYEGRYEAAVSATHMRDRVWPLAAPEGYLDRGRILLCQNNARAALVELSKGLDLEPEHQELRAFHALAAYTKGDIQEAHDALARLCKADPEALLPRLFQAMCAVRLGQHKQAFQLLDRRLLALGRVRGEVAYFIGGLYAALLEKPEAMIWLERAVAMGYENYPWFVVDFNLIALREEPGFTRLLEELRQRWEKQKDGGGNTLQ